MGTPNVWSASGASNWDTAGNWSLGHVPTTGETPTFNATSVYNCSIDVDTAAVDGISVASAYTGLITQNAHVNNAAGFDCYGDWDMNNYNMWNDGDFNIYAGAGFLAGSGICYCGGSVDIADSSGIFDAETGDFIWRHGAGDTLSNPNSGNAFNNLYFNECTQLLVDLDETSSPSDDRSGFRRDGTWSNLSSVTEHPTLQYTNTRSISSASDATAEDAFPVGGYHCTLPFSLSLWFYPTQEFASGSGLIAVAPLWYDPWFSWCLFGFDDAGNNRIAFQVPTSGWAGPGSTGDLAINEWHHVCIRVASNGDIYMRVDGTDYGPVNAATWHSYAYHSLFRNGWNFIGYTDAYVVFNRFLSTDEVDQLEDGYRGPIGGTTGSLSSDIYVDGDLYSLSGTVDKGSYDINLTGTQYDLGGTITAGQSVAPGGIASAEAFGTFTVTPGAVTITPTGIASAEAFGTFALAPGAVTITPTGIPSGEAFGTFSLKWIPWYFGSTLNVVVGSIVTGNLHSTYIIDSDRLTIAETAGTPGFDFRMWFGDQFPLAGSNLTVHITGYYSGNPAHNVKLQQWNYTLGQWDNVTAAVRDFPSAASDQTYVIPLLHTAAYFSGNKTRLRFNHTSPGNPAHRFYLNYARLVLELDIIPTGIPTGEAFGAFSLSPGPVYLGPTGIVSAEAFGAFSIVPGAVSVAPSGIPSGEAFGAFSLATGAVAVYPDGIPSGEAFGTPTITTGPVFLSPTGIGSEEAFGALTITTGPVEVAPTGIPGAEAFGTFVVGTGVVYLSPVGIPSAEAFGALSVSVGPVFVFPSGISSGEAFGAFIVMPEQFLEPTGIPSAEAFGALTVSPGPVYLLPPGIASGEAFGAFSVVPGPVNVAPAGIPSGETFGNVVLTPGNVDVSPVSIISGEAFGAFSVTPGPVYIAPSGIPSGETFGTLMVEVHVSPSGIPSAEAFGVFSIGYVVSPGGIPSAEAFGAFVVGVGPVFITPTGIGSGEAFGVPIITLFLTVPGIPSAEAFGVFSVVMIIAPTGIPSGETFGSLTVSIAATPGLHDQFETDIEDVFLTGNADFAEQMIVHYKQEAIEDTIWGIFDNEFAFADVDSNFQVQTRTPMATIQTRKLRRPLVRGDWFQIRGVTYSVVTSEPDGTGISVITFQHKV